MHTHRPLQDRLEWLRRFRGALSSRASELATIVSREVGKPHWEALTGDVLSLLAACAWHERHAGRLLKPRQVGWGGLPFAGVRGRVERHPLGSVAIIATWNYPLQLLGIQLVQAILAGNRVVVKPSEHAPLSARALLELALSCGLEPQELRWVEATREAGAALLSSERFDHIVFTGSTAVGRAIASVAAERLTPTTLELSGSDSAFVLDDADAALAARSIWNACTMNAGQTCMAPRRALVARERCDEFLAALTPLAAGARPQRLIDDAAARRAFDLAKEACQLGGRSVTGMLEPPGAPPRGAWMRPLAIADCPAGAPLVLGEHFGPVLAVVPFDDLEAALRVHRAVPKHLSTSVYTRRPARARELAGELGSSLVSINDSVMPAGHPGTGLSGRGLSGWGVSRGPEGLLAMTRPVYVTTTSSWLRPPVGQPTPAAVSQMNSALRWLFGGGRAGDDTSSAGPAAPARGGAHGAAVSRAHQEQERAPQTGAASEVRA